MSSCNHCKVAPTHTQPPTHTGTHTESDLLELKWMGINHKSLVNVAAY